MFLKPVCFFSHPNLCFDRAPTGLAKASPLLYKCHFYEGKGLFLELFPHFSIAG
jgi:hypothetical protein